VQRLILAQKAGSLTAVLRSHADTEAVTASSMDASELFGAPAPRKAGAVHGAPFATTEIIIGGKGGGRADRELLQMLTLDRAPPSAVAAEAPAAAGGGRGEALLDLLKAARPPSEAVSMAR
jgi:hypothetical protein